jgi:hypothetical protein
MAPDGIDVLCVHPSPINSNFYDNAKGVSLLTAFQKTALSPNVIAETMFKAAGRCIVRDQGAFCCRLEVRDGRIFFDWDKIVAENDRLELYG